MHLNKMPVVKPRALQMLIIGQKTQRLDKMKFNARPCAKASDISRIAGNLRLYKYDMQMNTPMLSYIL